MINVERIWWRKLTLVKVRWNAGAIFESEIVVAKHKMQIQSANVQKGVIGMNLRMYRNIAKLKRNEAITKKN